MEGNQQKMREAVEAALSELDKFGQVHDARIHFADIVHVGNAKRMLQEALAAPPRQCDVGTAEEQSERMEKSVCSKHRCVKCPYYRINKHGDCSLEWAQTPCEAEEEGAE